MTILFLLIPYENLSLKSLRFKVNVHDEYLCFYQDVAFFAFSLMSDVRKITTKITPI